ncbi:hypothetical protein BaRGS_00014251 [Batillaria attramentaria]|uniref:Uncharacterized protein n=1 Tax=Batillaria attramentaria TaxID=370345 RepID=A0ABD0L5T0_9CAEN
MTTEPPHHSFSTDNARIYTHKHVRVVSWVSVRTSPQHTHPAFSPSGATAGKLAPFISKHKLNIKPGLLIKHSDRQKIHSFWLNGPIAETAGGHSGRGAES